MEGSLDRLGLERRKRGPARLIALAALLAFFGAILGIVIASSGGKSTARVTTAAPTPPVATTPTTTVSKPSPPRPARPLKIVSATAYDPEGDQAENDSQAELAVDGDTTTFWPTETYHNFSKAGVGLVLDLGRTFRVDKATLTSDTPGFRAELQAGLGPNGPFHQISRPRVIQGGTTFGTKKPARARYVNVWITALPGDGVAHLNEIHVLGR